MMSVLSKMDDMIEAIDMAAAEVQAQGELTRTNDTVLVNRIKAKNK